ncbi:MAG: hypothetical protein R2834_09130 [Rhodothermales bacterium]
MPHPAPGDRSLPNASADPAGAFAYIPFPQKKSLPDYRLFLFAV